MSVGKRGDTSEPLTEHDVAERLDKAAVRTLRILMDARQIEGLMGEVKRSRYLTNSLGALRAELDHWGVEPDRQFADPDAPRLHAIIGRERALADGVANLLRDAARSRHNYGPISETRRGSTFRLELLVDGEPADRTAKVTVEMEGP